MYSPLLSEGVHTHRHLVKAFEPLNDIPQECTSWRFPNLESLEATFEDEGPGVYDFILGHPTLTCLHFFTRSTEGPGLMFWQTLLGFANLKELSLIEGDTTEKGMAFWEHCTRLECLDTTAQDLERFSGIRPSMVFPKIKELRVKTAGDDDDTYFEMNGLGNVSFPGSVSLHRKGRGPNLKVCLLSQAHGCCLTIPTSFYFLGCMKWVVVLKISRLQASFGLGRMKLLQLHLPHLKELDLSTANDLTSPMAHEILSSCLLLEKPLVCLLDANDVITGKPWVCTRLKELSVCFQFDPSKIHDHQPLVLDRLSRLARLERLCVDGKSPDLVFQETFDLRLDMGLDKLSTQRSLRWFSFRNTEQIMGYAEVDWIIEHWTRLQYINGDLDFQEPELDLELKAWLEENGISSLDDYGSGTRYGDDVWYEDDTYSSDNDDEPVSMRIEQARLGGNANQ
ncbi:hypothetical protein B0O80DRAFT_514984 [Mortierella sp. GBAus27b]|nr:hypothetical protein B0O80DRAFT_514984 [Mortierella sp. GBAus27b]